MAATTRPHREVNKLLHIPTVRLKALAAAGDLGGVATAADLVDLDTATDAPEAPALVHQETS